MITRIDVVNTARTWIDTPFHHQGRLKGVGVDCVGLIIGVAKELNLIDQDFNVNAYPRIPDGASLMHLVELHMTLLPRTQELAPGMVIVVRFESNPQHLGILGDYRHGGLSIIHAAGNTGRVIETRLLFGNHMKLVAALELPGVN